jgi:hypothetical protein
MPLLRSVRWFRMIEIGRRTMAYGYDYDEIRDNMLFEWDHDDDDLYLLKYIPKRSGRQCEATQFILDFKEGYNEAIELAISLLIAAVMNHESRLRREAKCRYLVCVPSSTAGGARGSADRACSALAERFSWLEYLPGALVRTRSVQKAAWAYPGERPDYRTHRETIEYKGPILKGKLDGFIMFDDVITRKDTSRACRDIIRATTGHRRVVGIYLGRTVWT